MRLRNPVLGNDAENRIRVSPQGCNWTLGTWNISTNWKYILVDGSGPEPGSEKGAYKRDLGYWFAGFDLFGQNSLCATQQARI